MWLQFFVSAVLVAMGIQAADRLPGRNRGRMKTGSRSAAGGRRLHQTTLSLGDQNQTTFTTEQKQNFSGRSRKDQPLIYQQRDPSYSSQHYSSADHSNISAKSSYTSTHSRDVHNPKDMTPSSVLRSLRSRNWTRNREGLAVKEITNPPESTVYISSYHTQYCGPANCPASSLQTGASGQPTRWHQHNILTGEDRGPARPETARRLSGDRLLWATRRLETDCPSLHLY
ncbi:hypothetical protein AMEX_G22353 [Astyanax mexicanus]|uniref:Uncharacterized protein n=1 Tax=Astyanax mexicanus TaxID=7994 RepID=A0A8T2L262_ASTMX|nr:hypothetical protein AMEX_G22353 [Astyanax mexicanus]